APKSSTSQPSQSLRRSRPQQSKVEKSSYANPEHWKPRSQRRRSYEPTERAESKDPPRSNTTFHSATNFSQFHANPNSRHRKSCDEVYFLHDHESSQNQEPIRCTNRQSKLSRKLKPQTRPTAKVI